jgi:hypothetical protein
VTYGPNAWDREVGAYRVMVDGEGDRRVVWVIKSVMVRRGVVMSGRMILATLPVDRS